MKKRITALCLVLVMILTVFPVTAFAVETGDVPDDDIHTPTKMVIVPDKSKLTAVEGVDKNIFICNDATLDQEAGKYTLGFSVCDQNGTDISKYVTWSSNNTAWLSFDDSSEAVATITPAKASEAPEVLVTATFAKDGERNYAAGVRIKILPPISAPKAATFTLNEDGSALIDGSLPHVEPSAYISYGLLGYEDDGYFSARVSASGYVTSILKYPGKHTAKYYETTYPANYAEYVVNVSGVAVEDSSGNTERTSVNLGSTIKLTPYTTDESYIMYKGDECDITWYSEDESIATVDQNGVVTPVKEGSVVIHAKDNYVPEGQSNGARGGITVSVQDPNKPYIELAAVDFDNHFIYDKEEYAADEDNNYAVSGNFYYGYEFKINSAVVYNANDTDKPTYYIAPTSYDKTMPPLTVLPYFDSETVNVELYHNGKLISDCTSGTISPNIVPSDGENDLVLKVSFKDSSKAGTNEYHLRFYLVPGEDNTNGLSSFSSNPAGIGLTSPDRALSTTVKYNNQNEGKIFVSNASGAPTKVAYSASEYNPGASTTNEMMSYVYADINNFAVSFATSDYIYGHVAYKIGSQDSEIVAEAQGKLSTGTLSFGDNKSVTLYIYTLGKQDFAQAKAAGEDPWASSAVKVFKYSVTKLGYKLSDFTVGSFDLGDTGSVYGFNSENSTMSGIVNGSTAALNLGGVTEGVTPYNVTSATANGTTKTAFTKGEDGTYTKDYKLSLKNGAIQAKTYIALQASDDSTFGKTIRFAYTVNLFQKNADNQAVLPTNVTEFLSIGGIHTNTYAKTNNNSEASPTAADYADGMNPERTVNGPSANSFSTRTEDWGFMKMTYTSSERNLLSLGNFGGSVTYYFADPIKNDALNPYGIDFVVYGQGSSDDKLRNASVYVSENGTDWYELAGSEHYDSSAIWNYQVNYTKAEDGSADYSDNLGRSGNLGKDYAYPDSKLYSLYDFSKGTTFTGTLLTDYAPSDTLSGTANNAAWGYVGIHSTPNGNTTVANPYEGTDGYGSGFDLDWAVDTNGLPVKFDEVHYVKVMAANLLVGGDKNDDLGAVVGGIIKTSPLENNGKTAVNSISINGEKIELKDGQNVYQADVKSGKFSISVDAGDATVYINNTKGATRSYNENFDFSKGIVRVVVQKGSAEPEIFYLKLTLNKGTIVLYTGNVRGDVDVYAQVKAVKDAYEAEGYKVLLLDAGNYLQGTTYANSDRGLGIYNLMDAAGYDAAAMGLAEFGYGDATTGYMYHSNFTRYFTQKELQEGAEAIEYKQNYAGTVMASRDAKAAAGFKALASNVTANDSYYSFTDSAIFTLNGKTIAVYGISNPEIAKNVQDGLITEISAAVKPENLTADYVICLSNASVSGSTYGDIVIDASGDEMIVGAYLIGDDGTITKEDVTLSEDHKDATVSALAEEIKAGAKKVIGTSDVILNGADSVGWNQETNLGDLVTDALTWYAKKYISGISENQPVIAIQNGGNCDNFLYSGDITETDLLKAFPFSPMGIGVIELTGAQLLRVLETSTQSENCPGFAQVSGLRYALDKYQTYDAGEVYGKFYKANSDNRVAVISVDGQPFDMDKTYTLVCDNYLIKGNDTYYTLKELVDSSAKYINDNASGRKVRDVVAMYIQEVLNGKIGSEYAQPQDRIVLLSQQEHDEVVSVNDLIALIGDEITLDSKDAIEAAESAYQALSDVQKLYVDKLSDLENARKAYDALVGHTHNYGEGVVTKESVNGEAGIRTYTCTVCGETKEEEFFVYHIVSGADQSVTVGQDATFTTDMAMSKLIRVEIDGKTVDASNYTVSASSEGTAKTAITLKGSFLKTLKIGSHTLKLVGTDAEVEAAFSTASAATPTTGDNGNAALYVTLMLLSVAAALVLLTLHRKRKV